MKKGLLAGIGVGIGATGIAVGAGIATVIIKRDIKKAAEEGERIARRLSKLSGFISFEISELENSCNLKGLEKKINEILKEKIKEEYIKELNDAWKNVLDNQKDIKLVEEKLFELDKVVLKILENIIKVKI